MSAVNGLTPLEILEIEEAERILEEYRAAEEEVNGSGEEVRQRFEVTGLNSLNWAFRKIAAFKKKIAKVEELAKEEVDRINAWKEKQLKSYTADSGFFEFLVSDWAEKTRAADPKFKKETTPFGEVAFKKQQPEWTYPDEIAVVEWCKKHEMESLVKKVESVADKTQFKKAFEIRENVIVRDLVDQEGTKLPGDGEVIDTIDKEGQGVLFTIHTYTEEEGGGFAIIDKESGEFAKGVRFLSTAVVERMSELVVPGVKATFRPDKLDIKAVQ